MCNNSRSPLDRTTNGIPIAFGDGDTDPGLPSDASSVVDHYGRSAAEVE